MSAGSVLLAGGRRPRRGETWPTAYRPLRPASLAVQLVLLVLVELALFQAYSVHDSRFHYATHLLVAILAAAAVQAAFLLLAARPARGQLLAIAGLHLLAMWPDLAFRAGVPHYRWMDALSLFHVSSHYLPGGDTSWLVLAGSAVSAYVALLAAWLRARRTEALAGLPPALGVGGSAVWRPQRDPRDTPLARVDTGPAGGAPALVLVPGLGATSAVWAGVGQALGRAGRRALAVDLLGYGGSLRTGTRFTVADQADALVRLLREQDRPPVLVGHSWGCLVAARAALDHPELVARLVLVSPAVFPDAATARERIGGRSWLARRTLAGAPVASALCGAMCLARPLLGALAGQARGDLPESVAHGGVQHVYPAYRDGLLSLWADRSAPDLLARPPVPVTLVLADDDRTVRTGEVLALERADDVRVVRVPGTHLLPVQDPERLAGLLLAEDPHHPIG